MDATLVRNLSDHRGNNLLHVVAGAGDADALAWLCAHFKPQIQDALLDENKRGLTPVVAAIQVPKTRNFPPFFKRKKKKGVQQLISDLVA